MKIVKKECLVICLVFLLSVCCNSLLLFCEYECDAIAAEVANTQRERDGASNNYQFESDVWIGEYESKVYIACLNVTGFFGWRYNGWLSVVEGKGIRKVCRIADGAPYRCFVGFSGQYLYYWGGKNKNPYLYCLDLDNLEETRLYEGDTCIARTAYWMEDGSFYVPIQDRDDEGNWREAEFLRILGKEAVGRTREVNVYNAAGKSYWMTLESPFFMVTVYALDEHGHREDIPHVGVSSIYSGRAVIPWSGGLLIHNAQSTHDAELLSINEKGEWTELFNAPGIHSYSAIAVHGTDAYFSLKRYEKNGTIGMRRYTDDEMEGTYRIGLLDQSVRKINDRIYKGLYNFGDRLYGCDEYGTIEEFDFDGNILRKLN